MLIRLAAIIEGVLASLIVAGCLPFFAEPVCSEFRQLTSTGNVGGSGSPLLGRLEYDLTEPRDSVKRRVSRVRRSREEVMAIATDLRPARMSYARGP